MLVNGNLLSQGEVLSGECRTAEQEATQEEEDGTQNAHESVAPKMDTGHPTAKSFFVQTVGRSVSGRRPEIRSRHPVSNAQPAQLSVFSDGGIWGGREGEILANQRKCWQNNAYGVFVRDRSAGHSPFPYDSFIRNSMPVYPGVFPGSAWPLRLLAVLILPTPRLRFL